MTITYVSSGHVASGTPVAANMELDVLSGGKAIATHVGSLGVLSAESGAMLRRSVISGGGTLTVSFGAMAYDTVVNFGGREELSGSDDRPIVRGELDTSFDVLSASVLATGTLVANNGGVYSATVLGTLLDNSGLLLDTTIASGGYAMIDLEARGVTVLSGGLLLLGTFESNSGLVRTVTVNAGGAVIAATGSIAALTVDPGGVLALLPDATEQSPRANNVGVNAGGTLILGGGASLRGVAVMPGTDVISTGVAVFDSGTIVTGATLTDTQIGLHGAAFVLSNGLAIDTAVHSGGSLTVDGGGTAQGVDVFSGAVSIDSGGVVDNLSLRFGQADIGGILDGGTIYAGGTAIVDANGHADTLKIAGDGLLEANGSVTSALIASDGTLAIGPDPALTTETHLMPGGTIDLRMLDDSKGSAHGRLGAHDMLTIYSGGTSVTLSLSGDYRHDSFAFGHDAGSGTSITLAATPATVLRAEAASAGLASIAQDLLIGRSAGNLALTIMQQAGSLGAGMPHPDLGPILVPHPH